MRTPVIKNRALKNVLSALAVAGLGFVLLNAAFIVDAVYQSAARGLIELLVPAEALMNFRLYPPLMHISFAVIVGLVSWPVLRSKLADLYKATYLIVPLAMVYATIGMFLYRWPAAVFAAGGLFGFGSLYFIHRAKKPWLYYYSLFLTTSVMAAVVILGIDI